jgi:hypothetical protein
MVSPFELWLPILLASVGVFVVSSIIHMVLPFHKNDYKKLPDEARFLEALQGLDIPPGDYSAPQPGSMKEYGSPEFAAKCERGPVAFMTILPSKVPSMGGPLLMWFLFSIVVSIFAAYVARLTLPHGSEYLIVSRVTGVVAFCGYSLALMQGSIWYKKSWSTTLKSMVDGLIYGLLTGGFFGWLWPGV